MNNQKDNNNNNTVNKQLSTVSSAKVSNYYGVFEHQTYVQLAQRSQKLVTALYMLTDFLETSDPMRDLIRTNSTDIMRHLFGLVSTQKNDRVSELSLVVNMIFANISYLDVIYRNGFISEMNYSLVNKELHNLQRDVDAQITKSLPYDNKKNNTRSIADFSFADSFFETENNTEPVSERHIPKKPATAENREIVKDTESNQQQVKKTPDAEPIFVQKTSKTSAAEYRMKKPAVKQTRAPKVNDAKEERKENIIKILKQKRDASINDISALIKDCSSKTIQRDLSELIDEGTVTKEGSRRWSKYNLSY
jgi:predicted transcriptional regulator